MSTVEPLGATAPRALVVGPSRRSSLLACCAVSSSGVSRFSAAGPALGYLAQVEYALLIGLQRMDTDVSLRLSLETADDIAFEADGQPSELWQTKHHINRRGSLGDSSPDLWKSLSNWIEGSDEGSACFLFSTATAPRGSAACLLRPMRGEQDLVDARGQLNCVATAAGNVSSAGYYRNYLSLTEDQRLALLRRVTVLDGAVEAAELTDRLVGAVRKSTVAQRRLPLVERLRGWWHGRVMSHLTRSAQGESDWIDLEEIEERLLVIAQSLRDDNLPLDFGYEPEPTASEASDDDRIFVEQLKMIMLHHDRIRQAVYDHNRAFLQRSRWQREQLLAIGELDDYDRRLVEEWKRVFLPVDEPSDDQSGTDKQRSARATYVSLQQRILPEIRPAVRSGYVPFGSLHILADRLQIGWHPDWVALLKHRLGEVPREEGAA